MIFSLARQVLVPPPQKDLMFPLLLLIFYLALIQPLRSKVLNMDVTNYHKEADNSVDGTMQDFHLPYYPFRHELTKKADSLFLHYRNKEALDEYQQANRFFRKANNLEGIAYTANMVAEIYTNRLEDYPSAYIQLRSAEAFIKESLGADHPLMADTYATYGSYFGRNGQTINEQEYLEKSLEIRTEYYGLQSHQVAEVNYRLGQMYQHGRLEYEKAKEHYKRALIIYRQLLPSNHPDIIKAFLALGSIYNYLDDLQRAKINLDQAIYKYSLDSISNVSGIARSVNIKANVLNKMQLYDQAKSLYRTTINLYEKLYGSESYNLIFAYMGLAVDYLREGEIVLSLEYLDRSIDIYNKFYSPESPIDTYPYILIDKGECFVKLGMMDSAAHYLFKALELRNTYFKEGRKGISYSYRSIADMYNHFAQYDSALYYSQLALIELDTGFNDMNYKENPEIRASEFITEFIEAFSLKARILRNIYKSDGQNLDPLIQALELYNKLDHLTDDLKNSDYAEESKLILINDYHKIYGEAIQCAYSLYQITNEDEYLMDAFKFFEKNKYMLLFQNMELARKSNELNLPFEYQFREDSLQMRLAEISQLIEMEDPQVVSELNSVRYEVDNALTELRDEIESEYPNLYDLEYDELTIEMNQLRYYAVENEALLLEYFTGDSTIQILAIGPDDISIHQIKRNEYLNHHIDVFLNSMSNYEFNINIQEDYHNFTDSGFRIYETILKPVLEKHNTKSFEQIIIAPDGILAQIPFEALLLDLPKGDYPDYSGLDYLIRHYNFHYVYSFNLFFKEQDKDITKPTRLMAFSYSGIQVSDNPEIRSGDFIELPGTNKEIESIRNIVKGKNLFLEDEEATETQFKNNAHNFQILHLAVHGLGDYESTINSRLVFKDQKDTLNDGNLFLYELYSVDLANTYLSILSACETGIGKEFKGEGVFSIARGFAFAGCPSIVMSLWKVNDLVSADLMAEFYRNLKKGSTISESLRASKLHFINSADQLTAHPGNWAAFVPLGHNQNVYEKKINWIMIGIILVVILPIIILIYRKIYD